MSRPEDMSTLKDLERRKLALQAARVWGFTYEVYLLHYLNSGPVSFGQRTLVTRPSIPPSNGVISPRAARIDVLDQTDPLAELRTKYKMARDAYRKDGGSPRLRWLDELEFALAALKNLHSVHKGMLGDYLNLCAWQVVQSTRGVRDSLSEQGKKALAYFEANYTAPYSDSDWNQLGDARINDERSELQIVSGECPRYTYQVTVDRAFSEVCSVIDQSMGVGVQRDPKKWQRDACGRLLSLGPEIGEEPVKDAGNDPDDSLLLDYIFPVRVQPDEDDWTGEKAKVQYRTDLSMNSSTLRLDFSLVKPDGKEAPIDENALLAEDSGYYLIRKSVAKVGRTDLIVQRCLWFSNRAFGMNGALRPLFKMIVDHRVLREFAELCRKPPPR